MSRFPRLLFFVGGLALGAAGALAAESAKGSAPTEESEPRFSSTLSPAQQKETGLDQLTTDNVAVIDALVRLDLAAVQYRGTSIRTTRFSERRTEHERDIAGLAKLTPAQLTKLDQFVALRIPTPAPPTLTADLPYATLGIDPNPVRYKRPGLETHGSVSLMYGWSKAGSVRGASSTVTLVDPKHRFEVTVGYSEYHGNGAGFYSYPPDAPYTPFYRPVPLIDPDDR